MIDETEEDEEGRREKKADANDGFGTDAVREVAD